MSCSPKKSPCKPKPKKICKPKPMCPAYRECLSHTECENRNGISTYRDITHFVTGGADSVYAIANQTKCPKKKCKHVKPCACPRSSPKNSRSPAKSSRSPSKSGRSPSPKNSRSPRR